MDRHLRFCALLLSILCLLSSFDTLAQEAWERIAVLGVNTRVIGFGSGTIVFAGTEGHGIWRSDDSGTTWIQSTSPLELSTATVNDIAVSPNFSTDKTVFCITQDGYVYRSADADTTFAFGKIKGKDQDRSHGTALAIHPLFLGGGSGGNQTLFAGYSSGELEVSTNAGGATPTWTRDNSTNAMNQIWDLAISPSFGTDSKLFVGGKADNGPCKLWTGLGSMANRYSGLGTAGTNEIVTSLYWAGGSSIWAGTKANGLYLSANEGVTWTAGCDASTNYDKPQVTAITRFAGTGPFLIEGRADAPYLSTDAQGKGTSCTVYSPPAAIQDVELQPSYDGTARCYIYFATPGGLLRKSTCVTGLQRGPVTVDGYDVAYAQSGRGKFMGSREQGLFKCLSQSTDPGDMVRYNNFPNKKTPQIAAICLDPVYDETSVYGPGVDCGIMDQSILFVAANFPDSPQDNGVYKSKDFGNTWTKMATNWPVSSLTVYDLAISPQYQDDGAGTKDTALFAATSGGLYRWDGSTAGWQFKSTGVTAEIIAVGLPPSYGKDSGPSHTVVIGVLDASLEYHVYKNDSDGDGSWTSLNYTTTPIKRGRVTGFAFARQYPTTSSSIWVSAITDPYNPSSSSPSVGGLFRYTVGTGWTKLFPSSTGVPEENVWDVAAEPRFYDGTGYYKLLLATSFGIVKTSNANSTTPTFDLKDRRSAYSIAYDQEDTSGYIAIAGFQGNHLGDDPGSGAVITVDKGESWPREFWGYHFLPDDVWASVAHERDSRILFSASPSMGVFVSEDQGISFRPWNKGLGGNSGPCPLRSGLGINMLANRRGTNLDIVWVGTADSGIKARHIYYNTSTTPPTVDLETEDGAVGSSWLHDTWNSSGTSIAGRWERIEVTSNTGCNYPVWATGQAWGSNSAQGVATLPQYTSHCWIGSGGSDGWISVNSGLPTSLDARGIRQGYQSLQNGTALSGEGVANGQWNFYQFQVPAGYGDVRFLMDDLDDTLAMDPDLYVRYGAQPNLSLYDYRPWINGDESVCIRPTATLLSESFSTMTLLSEDFASGIPGTWTVFNGGAGGGAAATWVAGNNTTPCTSSPDLPSPFFSPWAIIDSDCAGNGAVQDEQLITPTLNCGSYGTVFLTFTNQFHWVTGFGNDVADVDVSADGGATWTNALRMTGADNPSPLGVNTKSLDLSAYAAGKTSVKVRFHYTGSYDYWWAVDNVRVTGLPSNWSLRHDGSGATPAGTWTPTNPCGLSPGAPISGGYLVADSSCAAAGTTFYEILYTPAFNCADYAKITLSFDHQFTKVTSGGNGYVYVSNDGGLGWYSVGSFTSSIGPVTQTIDISKRWNGSAWVPLAAGMPNVRVRFYFADPGTAQGSWWAIDNVQVTGDGPKPGTWYLGIYGYATGTSSYNLTATLNSGCTSFAAPAAGEGKRTDRSEGGTVESVPQPEAPNTSTTWGTVSGSGVYKGTGAAAAMPGPGSVTWSACPNQVTNTLANTVVQLSDLTLIAGCTGNVYCSPGPDECSTTWIDATTNLAGYNSSCSKDFRDLLVSSNGDVLLAANGTGTGTSAGGVWLSGDKGLHWMRLSQGFDTTSQELTDLMADSSNPPSYYSSTDATGVYTRTITANPFPTVSGVSPSSGTSSGGTTVTVTGTGFLGTCPTGTASDCPSPNDRPVVLFGDTEVTPSSWNATSITVTSPAHASGLVKVMVRNPDTRRSTTGANYTYTCSAPATFTLTATDSSAYDFTGITLTWPPGPASWGDGGDTSRSYGLYRDGLGTGTYGSGTTSRSDSTAAKVALHTYKIRATNSCGTSTDTSNATASDDAEAGKYSNSSRDLKWHTGGRTQLDWGAVGGATSYSVYRGSGATLSSITSTGAPVCLAYSGATANTGAILASNPASGQFYWYLVTASYNSAEGTLGTTSGGSARKVSSSGTCGSP
jgi:hypothetical protein